MGGRGLYKGFWWGSQKEKDHYDDLGEAMMIMLKWMLQKLNGGGIVWIHLTQDRDQWWALVNAVMNLSVSIKR
jgi:hypothetical protein